MTRSAELTTFLTTLGDALGRTTGAAAGLAGTVIARMADLGTPGSTPSRLPVCSHIPAALTAYGGPLAASFAAIEGQFDWRRRASATPADQPFYDGHANATIFGPGGLEDHPGLWIGATIMAPHITYPDHDHPPAEVYIPLTPGEWWNADMEWTDPGPTGFIYNPPGIKHAMRSGAAPSLALWVLPI